jgi:hypothetical protein
MAVAHNCLTRLIRYAEARDLVCRNVARADGHPKGRPGRRSRPLTLDQAVALLTTAAQGRVLAPEGPAVRPNAWMNACYGVVLPVDGGRAVLGADPEARSAEQP